jgi:dynein heavy chain
MEQLETMNYTEKQINKYIREPSEIDMERYNYYIQNGLDKSMIAPLPEAQFDVFYGYISQKLKSQPCMKEISESIRDDVIKDYDFSMRKSILDYVLLNNEERKRVKIEWVPRPFVLK